MSALSAYEAMSNAVVGLLLSFAVTYFVLPAWGLTPTVSQALDITAMYFCVSFLRSWAIREAFRKWVS